MKRYYPCAIVPEDEGGYSVYFPDVPNCFTCGDTLEDALEMAEDVLTMMLQSMAEERKDIPEPSDIERVKRAVAAERAEGGLSMPDATVYQFVAAPSLDMVPVRVSVSFPMPVLALIDQKASVHRMTRSGFLARAAQAYGA